MIKPDKSKTMDAAEKLMLDLTTLEATWEVLKTRAITTAKDRLARNRAAQHRPDHTRRRNPVATLRQDPRD